MRIFYLWITTIALQMSLFAVDLEEEEPCFSKAEKLKEAETFVVSCGICTFDESFQERLEGELTKNLQEMGIVYSTDDSLLTKEQLMEKYTPRQTLMFVRAFPNFETLDNVFGERWNFTPLPIHEIQVKVIRGECDTDEEHFRGTAWHKTRYVSAFCDENECNDKIIKNLRAILKDFKNDYQKVNPSQKPHFFLCD